MTLESDAPHGYSSAPATPDCICRAASVLDAAQQCAIVKEPSMSPRIIASLVTLGAGTLVFRSKLVLLSLLVAVVAIAGIDLYAPAYAGTPTVCAGHLTGAVAGD